jgi:hypothetical protein
MGVYPTLALLGLIPGVMALRAGRIVLRRHSQFGELIPAQLMTIQIHMYVGILITVGMIASGLLL